MVKRSTYFHNIFSGPAHGIQLLQPARVLGRRSEVAEPLTILSTSSPAPTNQCTSSIGDRSARLSPARGQANEQHRTKPLATATNVKATTIVPQMDKHIDKQNIIEADAMITLLPTEQQQSAVGDVQRRINESNYPPALLRQQIYPSVARAEASHGEHARTMQARSQMKPEQPLQVQLLPLAQERRMSQEMRVGQSKLAEMSVGKNKQQESSLYIGTIDVHIVQAPPTPVQSRPQVRSQTAKASSNRPLAREFTSFVGLRQG